MSFLDKFKQQEVVVSVAQPLEPAPIEYGSELRCFNSVPGVATRIAFLCNTNGKFEECLRNMKKIPQIDLLVTLGNITQEDWNLVNELRRTRWRQIDVAGVLGANDSPRDLELNYVTNLATTVLELNGITFCGIDGVFKNKDADLIQHTDEESIEIEKRLRCCNFFISHDKPKVYYKNAENQGLLGVTNYLQEKKPDFHFYCNAKELEYAQVGITHSQSIAPCSLFYVEVSSNP